MIQTHALKITTQAALGTSPVQKVITRGASVHKETYNISVHTNPSGIDVSGSDNQVLQ